MFKILFFTMEKIERNVEGNEIGISIKYPDGINRKWSEAYTKIQCENCNSTEIETEINSDLLKINCKNCSNQWQGNTNKVLTWYKTEEAKVILWETPFEETEKY